MSNSSNNIYVRKTGIRVKAVPKSESKWIIIRRGLGSIRPHWAGCRRLARTERKPLMGRASVPGLAPIPGRAARGKKRAASSSPIPPFSLSLFSFFFFLLTSATDRNCSFFLSSFPPLSFSFSSVSLHDSSDNHRP